MHPSHLLRTDSILTGENQFTAPRNIDLGFANYDCGIVRLPWLTHRLKLHKFNNVGVYLTFFGFLGLLHGCCSSYFTGTSSVWRHNYQLSETYVEWIVYSSPIIGGLFAILIAYWGNRIHRVTWLGGLAMFHSVAGWVLLIPEIYHPRFEELNSSTVLADQQLCHQLTSNYGPAIYTEERRIIHVTYMFIYQIFHSMAYVSLICHGLSYIDDYYVKKIKSLRAVCLVVAIHEVGRYIGINLTLIPYLYNSHIFLSPVWLLTMVLIFIFGFLISLFPKVMLSLVIRRGVSTLLHGTRIPENEKPLDFWLAFKSLFNPVLLFNAFSAAFMSAALTNFQALREEFFKARFLSVSEDIYAFENFTQYIIKLTFECMLILVLAILITKYKPRIRLLILWMVFAYALVALLFSSYAFIQCEDEITMEYKTLRKACNYDCNCDAEIFAPVCGQGKTYYSACYAGCSEKQDTIYRNCSCIESGEATEGSCNQHKCDSLWFFTQANSTLTTGLCLTVTILHLLIVLRGTKIQEAKSISLGFYIMCTQLLPFFPFKFIFDALRDWSCIRTRVDGECVRFKDQFPTYLSIMTVTIMSVSVLFAVLLMVYARNVDLYKGVVAKAYDESSSTVNDADSDPKLHTTPLNSSSPLNRTYSMEDLVEALKNIEKLEGQRPPRPIKTVYRETTI